MAKSPTPDLLPTPDAWKRQNSNIASRITSENVLKRNKNANETGSVRVISKTVDRSASAVSAGSNSADGSPASIRSPESNGAVSETRSRGIREADCSVCPACLQKSQAEIDKRSIRQGDDLGTRGEHGNITDDDNGDDDDDDDDRHRVKQERQACKGRQLFTIQEDPLRDEGGERETFSQLVLRSVSWKDEQELLNRQLSVLCPLPSGATSLLSQGSRRERSNIDRSDSNRGDPNALSPKRDSRSHRRGPSSPKRGLSSHGRDFSYPSSRHDSNVMSPTRDPNSIRRDPNSIRRDPNSIRRDPNSIRRDPSSSRRAPNAPSHRHDPSSDRRDPNSHARDSHAPTKPDQTRASHQRSDHPAGQARSGEKFAAQSSKASEAEGEKYTDRTASLANEEVDTRATWSTGKIGHEEWRKRLTHSESRSRYKSVTKPHRLHGREGASKKPRQRTCNSSAEDVSATAPSNHCGGNTGTDTMAVSEAGCKPETESTAGSETGSTGTQNTSKDAHSSEFGPIQKECYIFSSSDCPTSSESLPLTSTSGERTDSTQSKWCVDLERCPNIPLVLKRWESTRRSGRAGSRGYSLSVSVCSECHAIFIKDRSDYLSTRAAAHDDAGYEATTEDSRMESHKATRHIDKTVSSHRQGQRDARRVEDKPKSRSKGDSSGLRKLAFVRADDNTNQGDNLKARNDEIETEAADARPSKPKTPEVIYVDEDSDVISVTFTDGTMSRYRDPAPPTQDFPNLNVPDNVSLVRGRSPALPRPTQTTVPNNKDGITFSAGKASPNASQISCLPRPMPKTPSPAANLDHKNRNNSCFTVARDRCDKGLLSASKQNGQVQKSTSESSSLLSSSSSSPSLPIPATTTTSRKMAALPVGAVVKPNAGDKYSAVSNITKHRLSQKSSIPSAVTTRTTTRWPGVPTTQGPSSSTLAVSSNSKSTSVSGTIKNQPIQKPVTRTRTTTDGLPGTASMETPSVLAPTLGDNNSLACGEQKPQSVQKPMMTKAASTAIRTTAATVGASTPVGKTPTTVSAGPKQSLKVTLQSTATATATSARTAPTTTTTASSASNLTQTETRATFQHQGSMTCPATSRPGKATAKLALKTCFPTSDSSREKCRSKVNSSPGDFRLPEVGPSPEVISYYSVNGKSRSQKGKGQVKPEPNFTARIFRGNFRGVTSFN